MATYTRFSDPSAVRDHLLAALPGAEGLVALLGLGAVVGRSGDRITLHCPSHLTGHSDKNPSFGIGVSKGRVVYNCFGCNASGDVFDLIALSKGLDAKKQFPAVLDAAARLIGYVDATAVRRSLSLVRTARPAARGGA